MVRFSKGKWKFSESDVYNLDVTLSPIIIAGLTKFLSTPNYGVPSCLLQELFPVSDPNTHTDEQLTEASLEFVRRIKCMIYAFEDKNDSLELCNLVFKDFTLVSGDLEKYRELSKIHTEKVQEGLQYFAQHYHHLWT